MIPQLLVGILAVLALAVGGYFVAREDGVRNLSETVTERFAAGDYLAALGAAERLKSAGGEETPELAETVREAAELLLAEDSLAKAKQALAEERPADARAFLSGSAAVNNSSFKYYEEARKVLADAEALAAAASHQTAVTIETLSERAKTEERKRKEGEAARRALEGSLQEKEKTLQDARNESRETRQKLEEAKKEAETKEHALAQEQARAKALMEQVEKESRSKFFTEFRTYRDMAQKGREQLESAAAEINGKRDVTALIFLSQGKILFEEAKSKVGELRSNRTPTTYQSRVDDLSRALEEFMEAAKQFRNAVVYIDEQNGTDFSGSMVKARTALANAVSLLSGVSELIVANPLH